MDIIANAENSPKHESWKGRRLYTISNLEKGRQMQKQVSQGHNIVADRWAGASNPHPHANPNPTHKYLKHSFFNFFTQSSSLKGYITAKHCFTENLQVNWSRLPLNT